MDNNATMDLSEIETAERCGMSERSASKTVELVPVRSAAGRKKLLMGVAAAKSLLAGSSIEAVAKTTDRCTMSVTEGVKAVLTASASRDDEPRRIDGPIKRALEDRVTCAAQVKKVEAALQSGAALFVARTRSGWSEESGDIAEGMLAAARSVDDRELAVAVISLIFGTGMWWVDLARLTVADVVDERGALRDQVVIERSGRSKTYYLSNERVRSALVEHVQVMSKTRAAPNLREALSVLGAGRLLFCRPARAGASRETRRRGAEETGKNEADRARDLITHMTRVSVKASLQRSSIMRLAHRRLAARLLEEGAGEEVVMHVLRGKSMKPGAWVRRLLGRGKVTVAAETGIKAAMRRVL